jgi:hypothetical protein
MPPHPPCAVIPYTNARGMYVSAIQRVLAVFAALVALAPAPAYPAANWTWALVDEDYY